MRERLTTSLLLALAVGWLAAASACAEPTGAASAEATAAPAPKVPSGERATAIFAGGCFWCMEAAFEKVDGVIEAVSGYTGGSEPDPTYKEVSYGHTGHAESVEVAYDPAIIDYAGLLDVFWHQIDPTDAGGQFADRGNQYRTAIFVLDAEQRRLAEASRDRLEREGPFDEPIVTEIVDAGPFYPAEEYHQDYYKKNPGHYQAYRRGSGREAFLERVWGPEAAHAAPARRPAGPAPGKAFHKPSDDELRKELSALQYYVTQENGTERPFDNAYWDNHEAGIYVDVVSGEPLFSSKDKFDSGTGWPSFTKPLVEANVVEKSDRSAFMVRTEVRSAAADSHLGHVFDDGPAPTGLRYCINSAALRFVPRGDLEREGYGEYAAQLAD